MFTNVPDFISSGLATLVEDHDRLHSLFATYNNVRGYGSGKVDSGVDSLTIQVQNGNLEYSPFILLGFVPELTGLAARVMVEEGRQVQSDLENSLDLGVQEEALGNSTFLAIVYAGLSAFRESVDMARKIKTDKPKAKVVVLTCNCKLFEKKYTLNPMLADGILEAVVVTPECGGREDMKIILESLISIWNSKADMSRTN